MPPMRAQNDLRRAADLGDLAACLADTGGLSVPPVCFLYEARPLAFSPPAGFLPSLRCHAAVFLVVATFGFLSFRSVLGNWSTSYPSVTGSVSCAFEVKDFAVAKFGCVDDVPC